LRTATFRTRARFSFAFAPTPTPTGTPRLSKTPVTASIMRPTHPTSGHTWVSTQRESFLLRDTSASGRLWLKWTKAFKQRWQGRRKGWDLLSISDPSRRPSRFPRFGGTCRTAEPISSQGVREGVIDLAQGWPDCRRRKSVAPAYSLPVLQRHVSQCPPPAGRG